MGAVIMAVSSSSSSNILWLVAIVTLLATIHLCTSDDADVPWYDTKTRLMGDLFDEYNRDVGPYTDLNTPVDVTMYARVRSILDVDTKNGLIKVLLRTHMWYQDDRLRWNSSKYDDITHVDIPADQAWLPDIFMTNSSPDRSVSGKAFVSAYYTGTAAWDQYGPVTATCTMDVNSFPRDEQLCTLEFTSWGHTGSRLRLLRGNNDLSMHESFWHANWEILSVKMDNKTMTYGGDNEYYYVYINIKLRRQPSFFLYLYVAPPVIVAILVPLSFLLHPTGSHRCFLGSGLIICMSFLIGSFDWLMPAGSGGMPKLGAFYVGGLVTAVLSMMTFVFLGVLSQRAKTGSQPPDLISTIIGEKLASLMCVNRMSDDGPQMSAGATETESGGTSGSGGDSKASELATPSNEWLHLTSVLDRAFFFIFSLIFCLMAFICLV